MDDDVFVEGIRCWVCPGCGFTFDAEHVNTDGSGYSCPVCEMTDLRISLAQRLRDEAEIARMSPNGKHPQIFVMTQAAALRFASDVVQNG